MSPRQSDNPDPNQERRPPEQQTHQAGGPPPGGGQHGGGQQGPQQGGGQQGLQQGGGQQGPQQGGGQRGGHQGGGRPQQGGRQPGGQQQGRQGGSPQHGGPQQGPPEQFPGQPSGQGGGGQRSSGMQGNPGGQPSQPPQGATQGGMAPTQQPMGQPTQGPPQGGMPPAGMGGPQGGPQQFGATGQLDHVEGQGLQSPSVNEIIQTDVVTVESDAEITEVVEKMASEEVGSVIVVEDDEPIGVITDRSIALSLTESADLSDRTAEDFLSDEVVTGNTDMTVFDVLDQLEDNDIRRLPIVNEEGSLEGIVTLDDIFVLVNAEMDNATSIIESQSPRY